MVDDGEEKYGRGVRLAGGGRGPVTILRGGSLLAGAELFRCLAPRARTDPSVIGRRGVRRAT